MLPPTAVADLMIYQLLVAGGPRRRGGPQRLLQAGRRHPGRRDSCAALPLTLRSDPAEPGLECAPFVIAHAVRAPSSRSSTTALPLGADRLDRATARSTG